MNKQLVDMQSLRAQVLSAAKVMEEYVAYARSIGAVVVGDSIECDTKQARKLHDWWKQRTFAAQYGTGVQKMRSLLP